MTDTDLVTLEGGETLRSVHPFDKCIGEFCTIHNMSDHPLRNMAQHWNGAYMERINLDTGDIWPDPDDPHKPEFPNAARCTVCDEVLYSRRVHDFVSCSGGHIFIDGGSQYMRCGFDDVSNFEMIREWPINMKRETNHDD